MSLPIRAFLRFHSDEILRAPKQLLLFTIKASMFNLLIAKASFCLTNDLFLSALHLANCVCFYNKGNIIVFIIMDVSFGKKNVTMKLSNSSPSLLQVQQHHATCARHFCPLTRYFHNSDSRVSIYFLFGIWDKQAFVIMINHSKPWVGVTIFKLSNHQTFIWDCKCWMDHLDRKQKTLTRAEPKRQESKKM